MSAVASDSWPYWGIEHRRNFSNLKDDQHIPGYTGYLPQYKYQLGGTYAQNSAELAKTQIVRKPLPPIPPKSKPDLPSPRENNGLNKYMQRMVPGYTGYVPHRRYNFGENYNDDCNRCIASFLDENEEEQRKLEKLHSQVHHSQKLSPIATSEAVLERIKDYNATRHSVPSLDSRRSFLEPPKLGWTGYVPRIKVTDIALGKRRTTANEDGLHAFQADQELWERAVLEPIDPNARQDDVPQWAKNKGSPYHADGLKPSYTGFVPLFPPELMIEIDKTWKTMNRGVYSLGTHFWESDMRVAVVTVVWAVNSNYRNFESKSCPGGNNSSSSKRHKNPTPKQKPHYLSPMVIKL